MHRRQRELDAVAWGLDEAERQLRDEPAHRLRDERHDPYGWSLDAPNGVGVWVESGQPILTSEGVEITLLAGATGLFTRTRLERVLTLPLTGHAARVPSLLYLVFESGGHVYAIETLEEAGDSLESMDLVDGHYLGAYSDQGERITMSPGDLWIKFSPSGSFDPTALAELIHGSCHFSEFADDPHRFALAVWRSG